MRRDREKVKEHIFTVFFLSLNKRQTRFFKIQHFYSMNNKENEEGTRNKQQSYFKIQIIFDKVDNVVKSCEISID